MIFRLTQEIGFSEGDSGKFGKAESSEQRAELMTFRLVHEIGFRDGNSGKFGKDPNAPKRGRTYELTIISSETELLVLSRLVELKMPCNTTSLTMKCMCFSPFSQKTIC